jgi:hypothetical protein
MIQILRRLPCTTRISKTSFITPVIKPLGIISIKIKHFSFKNYGHGLKVVEGKKCPSTGNF